MKQLISDAMIKKLYYHWTYGVACLYCFFGLIGGLFLGVQAISKSVWPMELPIAVIISLGAMVAGGYIMHIESRENEISDREFAKIRKRVMDGEL